MGMVIGKKERESAIINRKIILNLLRKKGELSQRQLCDLTGLHRSTLSKLVSWLMENGFVEEAGQNPTPTGGKKQTLLRITNKKAGALGIGLYTTKLSWVCMDLSGKLYDSGECTFEGDLLKIGKTIKQLIDICPIPITTVGLGLPGIIDSDKGHIVWSAFLKIKNLDLGEILTEELNLPCFIDNDVRLMGALECDPNAESSTYIGINARAVEQGWQMGGFGCAIMSNGKLLRGSNSAAGEIYIFAKQVVGHCPTLTEDDKKQLATEDSALSTALNSAATWLSKVLIHLSAILDPEEVIIGGAIAFRNKAFLKQLNKEVKDRHLIYCPDRKLAVKPAKHPHTNMAEGAAHAAFDRLDAAILLQP